MATTDDRTLPGETGVGGYALARIWAWGVEAWERPALAAILILAAVLEFWRLGAAGYPNTYYAAGVRSMLENRHNFFFNSFDPAGFVTIDKPPLGFWLQVLSAKIFGFHPWSVLLPEALAGVASVALLYYLVARVFGGPAGLLAALALALTPINTVTDRNNVVDGLLVFTVLLAAWAVTRAVETGKTRWLLLGAALIGLGFNVKMLEAFLVLPALGLMYLLGAHVSWSKRAWQLGLAAIVLAVISASWITIVDLTPAADRPYVGSTTTNSEWDLAIGYNGLQRLNGRGSGRFGRFVPPPGLGRGAASRNRPNLGGFTAGENGAPAVTRLFNQQIGTQVSWLLPMAILGLIVAAARIRPRFPLDPRQSALVLWGMWGLTQAVFFSMAQFFHIYYMVMMTPAICALFGIGMVALWDRYRAGGWAGWLLPIAVALTAAVEIYMIRNTPNTLSALAPVIGVAATVVVVALVEARLFRNAGPRVRVALMAAGALALLIGPGIWTQQAVASGGGSAVPGANFGRGAGPAPARPAVGRSGRFSFGGFRGGRGAFGPDAQTSVDPKLIAYLNAHQDGRPYYVAGEQSFTISPIIIATGKPAIALGGFSGGDPIATVSDVQSLIRAGKLRYFLLPSIGPLLSPRTLRSLPPQVRRRIGGFGGFGGADRSGAISTWVVAHCRAVPPSRWQSTRPPTGPAIGFGRRAGFGGQALYDCG